MVTWTAWTGSQAAGYGFVTTPPAASPLQVPVATTAGDWLVAIAAWRQPQPGQGVSIAVADDAHNWWEPAGAPAADSPAAGTVRTAVWVAPAARAARYVQVAPTAPCIALAAVILDVAGLQPWYQVTGIASGYAQGAASLGPLALGAPPSSALLIAALANDKVAGALADSGAGWTTLATVTATNGSDALSDIQLLAQLQQSAAAVSATLTSSASADLAGTVAGVLISAAAPAQPSPAWPVVITEAAIGSGPQSPPAAMSWTSLSPRALELSIQQGRQYTLAQLQAGQGALRLDNPDGALIPPGTGALAGIDSGTPVRQRVILPATATPHYVAFSGYLKRWPFAAPGDMLRGETQAELTDIWAYAAGTLDSMARREMLLDSPYALWPLSDPAGATTASNIAPGNSNPLVLTASKYGAAGATAVFGATPPGGALTGDANAKVAGSGTTSSASGTFQQVLPPSALTGAAGYGYALGCADPGYPPISGGVTIECWAQSTANSGTLGFSNTGNTITLNTGTSATASYPNGTQVIFSGAALPAGMTAGIGYWVISSSGATFQISTAPGGSAVTLTTNGSGAVATTTPWSPVIWSIRNAKGQVASLAIRNTDGALMLNYQPVGGAAAVGIPVDTNRDWRLASQPLTHFSVSLSRAAWRVLVDGGGLVISSGSGNFSGQIAGAFTEFWHMGIQDRTAQGYAMPGYSALAAIYPGTIPQPRVIAHWASASYGLSGDPADDRVERAVEYAGIAGRRLVYKMTLPYAQSDITASGKDVGGASAAQMASNIQQSTVPALLYVAPTGDITYLSKQYSYNQPVRWTLGDNAAGGEVPFQLDTLATDYDPARVVNDIQVTQLDTQSLTLPAGVMASATVAAIEAASQQQYGDQPYQATGYLGYDYNGAYSSATLQDLANWAAMVYRKPANRVQAVTVSAAASSAGVSSPSRWRLWAGASVGDMVTVNVRLPTAATSPLVSLTARITQTSRAMKWATDGAAATIGLALDFAPEYQALTCDDAVRGLLDGSNVLPWLRASPCPQRRGGGLMPQPVLPSPRTWSAGDLVSVPRLRGDVANAVAFLLQRPSFAGQQTSGPAYSSGSDTALGLQAELTDNWNGHVSVTTNGALSSQYWAPVPGWYLVRCTVPFSYSSTTQAPFAAGLQGITGGVSWGPQRGPLVLCGSTHPPLAQVTDLVQMTASGAPGGSGDWVQFMLYQATGSNQSLVYNTAYTPYASARWACAISGTAPLPVPPLTPVPSPITSAWLNADVRDTISQLIYPPVCRATLSGTPSMASGTLAAPATVPLSGTTVDNYAGFSAATHAYTAPVAGRYLVAGQWNLQSSAASTGYACGISVNSGARAYYGDDTYKVSDTSGGGAGIYKRIRLNAGDTVTLTGVQGSGGAIAYSTSTLGPTRMIIIWEGK